MHTRAYLLQKASQDPFALTVVKFLPSFTSTCKAPLPDAVDGVGDELLLRALAGDFMLLPNLRKFKPPLPPLPLLLDGYLTELRLAEPPPPVSGGIYLSPTIMSPRYVVTSSNGSVCVRMFC